MGMVLVSFLLINGAKRKTLLYAILPTRMTMTELIMSIGAKPCLYAQIWVLRVENEVAYADDILQIADEVPQGISDFTEGDEDQDEEGEQNNEESS